MESGESAVQEKLPEKFKATPAPTSPIAGQLRFAAEWLPDIDRSPVVCRVPRMGGMRYLYARGAQRQPIERLGVPGGLPQRPWVSAYQPNDMGPIRDAGFYDRLFQGGYPGFNLGLSFKVQTIAPGSMAGAPRSIMNRRGPGARHQSDAVNKSRRPVGRPHVR